MPPRTRRQFSYLSYENLCINDMMGAVPNLSQLPGTHSIKHTRLNESLALLWIWLSTITTRHFHYIVYLSLY